MPALMAELINPQHLDQHHKDPNTEIKIACDLGAEGCGQGHAALTEHEHQGAFALGDEVGDTPVQSSDREAKKKSRNFEWHNRIVGRAGAAAQ
jgi:hypothetical protein